VLNRITIAAALSCTALTAAPAYADAAADDQATIVVTGQREPEPDYRITSSVTGMRTDTPLLDTPQSVSVVTSRQVLDQAATSIGDALRYTPGVFSAQGEGNRETLVLRGMTTTGDFFVDGIRDDVQTYRDLYNIDRLEVFRGSNAMAFGRGGTGGLVNRVTKVAAWRRIIGLRAEAGSFDHYRASVDLGTPVSEALALRLTGVYENSGSYRDGGKLERWGVNPTAAFRLGGKTTIQIGYEHFRDARIADRGIPSALRPTGFTGAIGPIETGRGTFFGDPVLSPTYTNTDAANLYVEHVFSDKVSLRNRTRYAEYDKFYANIYPASVNATTLVNTATTTAAPGLPVGSYAPGSVVQILAYDNATRRKNLINQTDLNAHLSTGSVEHLILAGAEFGRQKTENRRLEGFFPSASTPTGLAAIFAPVASPRVNATGITFRPIASSADNAGTLDIAAGYLQDQITFSPQLQIVLGVRFEHLVTNITDRRTVGFPTTQRRNLRAVDNLWSPRAAIIFKPAPNASLYASASRSWLPRGGDQLNGLNLSNEALRPERYTNYEIGAKWDVRPDLTLNAAVYQLDRENVTVTDPANPTLSVLGGGQRSRGIELSVTGKIVPQLMVVGSYTYQDAVFVRTVTTPGSTTIVAAGARVANAPEHAGSLWLRYDPVEKIGVALGAVHQGKRFAAQDNLVALPAYTRFDAALYVKLNDALDLQLNVENLANTRYFPFAHNNNNITPGAPRSARVAINARF
jgi:catecholate siderophore receptor